MDFSAGETVITSDEQVGTVLTPLGPGRGYLEYEYWAGRSKLHVAAYPVLLDGGEIRIFTAKALRSAESTGE